MPANILTAVSNFLYSFLHSLLTECNGVFHLLHYLFPYVIFYNAVTPLPLMSICLFL